MEFLKIIKRRSFINEVVYIVLNVALALTTMILVRATGTYWPAILLVLISKWRILAVRPRFWVANIQANLVSIIVSISHVIFLYLTQNVTDLSDTQVFVFQSILVLSYISWLLFIKPKSKRFFVVMQGGIALMAGLLVVFATLYSWPVIFTVAMSWVITYSSTKHVLGSYDDEKHIRLLSSLSGLVVAEISWLAYHWLVAYNIPFVDGIILPQSIIIIFCLAFLFYKSYDSYYKNQFIKLNDIILPLIFTISLVTVLLIFFNGINISSF